MIGRLKGYKALPLNIRYWRPGDDFIEDIVKVVKGKIRDGDYVVISEKAISTALGNILNESNVKAGLMAHILARFWTRIIWGFFLGRLCRLHEETIERIRNYPILEGSLHKQTVLVSTGFLNSLMFGSEGGIDGTNLPYSYVALPLPNPQIWTKKIRNTILEKLSVRATVMISDTDKTYSFGRFHFTPRPTQIRGIRSFGGFLSYMLGRMFKLDMNATPLAISGKEMSPEEALKLAEVANRARGHGVSRTIIGMTSAFGVHVNAVTWEMMSKVPHKPVVLIRSTA